MAPSAISRSETLHDSGLLVRSVSELGLRPIAFVGLERGEHVLEPVGGEQRVICGKFCSIFASGGVAAKAPIGPCTRCGVVAIRSIMSGSAACST